VLPVAIALRQIPPLQPWQEVVEIALIHAESVRHGFQ
jgi:hypothetical protein